MAAAILRRGLLPALLLLLAAAGAHAAELDITITYLTKTEPPRIPLSLVQPILKDAGLKGAELGIKDDQTTGQFLKNRYELKELIVPEKGDLKAAFEQALKDGQRLFVADLHDKQLQELAPLADKAGALLMNTRAQDNELRTDICFKSLFNVAPSRAMLADALAQYLVWKRWNRWFLVKGSHPEDAAYAANLERAAKRFGARIVATRTYVDKGDARRSDTGHIQIQSQMPVFTQNVPDYDVLAVADEADVFGEYLPYTTWDPRPTVGTVGLVPTTWSPVNEQWGGMQLQDRFQTLAGRQMTPRDFSAWVAVRSYGEAVTRTQSDDPQKLRDYLLSPKFQLGGFKGDALSFRRWNQQMRQPILLVTPRMLVSVSPQKEFLHRRNRLDTLGFDKPESRCQLNP